MRDIKYIVSIDKITPSTDQDAGFQCEYKATRITYELDEQFMSAVAKLEGRVQYMLEAINGEGVMSIYCLEPEQVGDKLTLSIDLPEAVTIPGTKAQLQLSVVALDENNNMTAKLYAKPTSVKFSRSIMGELIGTEELNRYSRNLVGAMQVAVSAAETSSEAAGRSNELYNQIISNGEQIISSATESAQRAESAVARWEFMQEIVLEEAVSLSSHKVENFGDTSKGVRVKVTIPTTTDIGDVNVTLPDDRLRIRATFPGSREVGAYAANWALMKLSPTMCVFEITKKADLWSIDLAPCTRVYHSAAGDINSQANDKVRYVNFYGTAEKPIPKGTKFEFWRLV